MALLFGAACATTAPRPPPPSLTATPAVHDSVQPVDAGVPAPRVTRFVRGSLQVEVDGTLGWFSGGAGVVSGEPAPAENEEAGFLRCSPAPGDQLQCVSRFKRFSVTVPAGRFERLTLLDSRGKPLLLALTADGTLALGDLQLTRMTVVARGVRELSVAGSVVEEKDYACVVTGDRRVLCLGSRLPPMRSLPATAADLEGAKLPAASGVDAHFVPVVGAKRVVTARTHLCVLLEDGTPSCFGAQVGQLGVAGAPPGTHPQVDDIAVAEDRTCLLFDGGVECVGRETRSVSPPLTEPVEVASGVRTVVSGDDFLCMLRLDGTVRCLGAHWRGLDWATGQATPFGSEVVDALFANRRSRTLCTQKDSRLRCFELGQTGFVPVMPPVRAPRFTRAFVMNGQLRALDDAGALTEVWFGRRPDVRRSARPKVLDLDSSHFLLEGGKVVGWIGDTPRLISKDVTRVFDTDPSLAMTSSGEVFVYGQKCVERPRRTSNDAVPLVFGLMVPIFLPFLFPNDCSRWEFQANRMPELDGSRDFGRATGLSCRIDSQGAARCSESSREAAKLLLNPDGADPAQALSAGENHVCALTSAGRVWCTEWAPGDRRLLSDLLPQVVRPVKFSPRSRARGGWFDRFAPPR